MYGKGGVAWANDKFSTNAYTFPGTIEVTDTRIGWTAGDHSLQPAVLSQAQGDAQAKAMLGRRGGQFVSGELTCEGNPQLRPGAGVRLAGVPTRFAGDYAVASCVHRFDQAHGYRTLVRLARGGVETGATT